MSIMSNIRSRINGLRSSMLNSLASLDESAASLNNTIDHSNEEIAAKDSEIESLMSEEAASMDEVYGYLMSSGRKSRLFYYCVDMTEAPMFDTSSFESMVNMFYGCTNLTTVPLYNTRNVTDMTGMFGNCTNLTTVPLFDTRNVVDMVEMFVNCTNLTTVPLFDTRNVVDMSRMFYGCANLTTIPEFDVRNVETKSDISNGIIIQTSAGMSGMFTSCTNLTECRLRNIKANLQVDSGTSYGHLLTVDSLIHLIKELRNVNAARTLTIGAANLEKLANVYVRTIDVTDEMRAEDDLIDEKLPFELCESTDENAMLITDYALEKRWTIK